jgi:hypothetical protein
MLRETRREIGAFDRCWRARPRLNNMVSDTRLAELLEDGPSPTLSKDPRRDGADKQSLDPAAVAPASAKEDAGWTPR